MAAKKDITITVVIVGSAIAFFLLIVFMFYGALTGEGFDLSATGGDKIGVIEIYGTITDSREIVRQLKKYSESDNVPAVILDINSPGGAVVPALEIYEEIQKVREDGLIVVASLGSVAASGAYLIACGCDTIIANSGSMTGSIGTILSYPVANELMDKVGLKYETIKSGKYKDVGNFARPVTKDDREMLQNLISDAYRQFAEIVSESRDIPILEVHKIAQGQVYSGAQSLDLGLVDKLGDYYDAVDTAAKMAGIEGKPKTIKEVKKRNLSIWDILFNNLAQVRQHLNLEKTSPKLEYIMN